MNPVFFIYALEVLAFLASIYYYQKDKRRSTRYLVIFLGFTAVLEIICRYPRLISEEGLLYFLLETPLEKNYWVYNIYLIISTVFYVSYFKWQLQNKKVASILSLLTGIFVIAGILYLVFSGVFFVAFSPFTVVVGTLLILLSISLYYLELLKSNQILSVFRSLPFYVSIGALIFHLCTTPLFIYSNFYKQLYNPDFVSMYRKVIYSSSFVLYTGYIIGFIICRRHRKQF